MATFFFGEGFIQIHDEKTIAVEKIQNAMEKVQGLDWRLQGFVLTVD
ncbi:MAG: hypothetical protein HC848_01950 [Limnobacter sp.]|nr:hypothetical protein [Limnobacter sp.]